VKKYCTRCRVVIIIILIIYFWSRLFVHRFLIERNHERRFYSRLLKSDKKKNRIGSFAVTDFSALRRFISGPSGEAPAEHGRGIKMPNATC